MCTLEESRATMKSSGGEGRRMGCDSLELLKNRPITTTKRATNKEDGFLSKVVDYLMSDLYMYSHVLSPLSSLDSSFVRGSDPLGVSSSTVGGMQVTVRESKMKLRKRIGRYLKSDTYLYAPLINTRKLTLSTASMAAGQRLQLKKVTREIRIQLNEELARTRREDQAAGKGGREEERARVSSHGDKSKTQKITKPFYSP